MSQVKGVVQSKRQEKNKSTAKENIVESVDRTGRDRDWYESKIKDKKSSNSNAEDIAAKAIALKIKSRVDLEVELYVKSEEFLQLVVDFSSFV
jgi:hypothetical protein